jgi:hypothetical protein
MFGISRLTNAIATLTQNVLALAGTVGTINEGLRTRLALDAPEDTPAVIDHKGPEPLPVRRKGKTPE